jgi:c-di-GMP-binding flagellar brake protein YcgR
MADSDKTPRSLVPAGEALQLLGIAAAAHVSLTLRFDGRELRAPLLALLDDGRLVTSVPPSGDAAVELGDLDESGKVSVEYLSDRVLYSFDTTFAGYVPWQLDRAMALRRPEATYRVQRRSFFRVAAAPGTVAILAVDNERRLREVLDVSGGGAGIILRLERDADIHAGLALSEICLRIPDEDEFRFTGVVRHVRRDGEVKGCGVEFVGMEQRERDRLIRYATRREREVLGRRAAVRAPAGPGAVAVLPRTKGRARVRRAILNVSAGGALILLGEEDRDVVRGARIPGVELQLPGEEPIAATAVVVRLQESDGRPACAVELRDVPVAARERLARYARLHIWGVLRP